LAAHLGAGRRGAQGNARHRSSLPGSSGAIANALRSGIVSLLASELPVGPVLGLAFCFGAIWGSFFNVAIYRWPRDMSVVRPASHCPGCGKPVAWRYNLPIIGFLLLRGKTACCGQTLSLRYPLVELLSALLCVALVQRFLLAAPEDMTVLRAGFIALAYFAFVGGLVIATFVDLEFMEIPDEVSLPGTALGLATAVVRMPDQVADAALGAGFGYLVVQVVFVWGYELLLGRRGMGEGDSKLLLMVGAFLGYQGVLFSLFAGAAQGLIAFAFGRVALAHSELALVGSADEPPPTAADEPSAADRPQPEAAAEERDEDYDDEDPPPTYWGHLKLPFGPFLALGALEFLFFGDAALELWSRWLSY
jgi:leader peptidase (prepilin peptidase)/N-methyltransferase